MPKVSDAYIEERRQQILEAAIACFVRKGFHQTTMDDIGREAGLSHGVAYRYFDSKEGIIQATLAEGDEGRTALLLQEMLTEPDNFDNYLHTMDVALRMWVARFERPGMDATLKLRVHSWAEALQNPQVREQVLDRWDERLNTKSVVQAQERGLIDPELDAQAIARAVQSLFDGLVLQWAIDPTVDLWKYREVMMAMIAGLIDGGN
jgi:AcrR family transcriptional regulator